MKHKRYKENFSKVGNKIEGLKKIIHFSSQLRELRIYLLDFSKETLGIIFKSILRVLEIMVHGSVLAGGLFYLLQKKFQNIKIELAYRKVI